MQLCILWALPESNRKSHIVVDVATLPRARKFACIFHPMHANFNNFALVQQRVR